jgi:RecB family exonuclease
MPWASPQDALRRSRALVARLRERAPVCVFSWPVREDEQAAEPSPLIREFPRLDSERMRAAAARGSASDRAGANLDPLARFAGLRTCAPVDRRSEPARTRETVADDDASPLPGVRLPGGIAALNAQAHCPLRAFCTYRLGAHPLEPYARGIPIPLQGLAVHAALERFFGVFDSLEALTTTPAAQRRDEAQHCAEEALTAIFGSARSALSPLFELEHQRLTSLIEQLAAKEMQRAVYRVVARERREALQIAGRVVTTRIDRVDALEDGSFAILDYKSGRGGQPAAWFEMRPRDVQLPVYALTLPHVTALVFVNVRSDAIGYAGCWQTPGDFPGRSRATQNALWPGDQIEAWRCRIGMLVDEYAAGDTRIPVRDYSPAEGALAPLTRVYEQVALYRGWSAPWPA